jgi:hypothetical protein
VGRIRTSLAKMKRAAFDAVRAARQMPELRFEDRTVVWGHS